MEVFTKRGDIDGDGNGSELKYIFSSSFMYRLFKENPNSFKVEML